MSALSILKKECDNKPYISFDNLPKGDYLVSSFDLIEIKTVGLRLRLDLGDKVVFLPERFSKNFTIEHCHEMNAGEYIFKYMGKDARNHNRLIVDFVELSRYQGPFYSMQ